MTRSCIVKHFNDYTSLGQAEEELLNSLEREPMKTERDHVIWDEGDPARSFFTIRSGWLYSYRNLEDGSRQVLDIFVPGDVAGLREFSFSHRLTGLTALTNVEICEFPKSRLTEVFRESPLLSRLFFAIAAREQAVLLERLVNLGRRSARQRMAHFILEVFTRLKRTNTLDQNGRFPFPIPQHVLGDALGLSAVHVSRTFSELKNEGLLENGHRCVTILDATRLRNIADFNPNYLGEDLSMIALG